MPVFSLNPLKDPRWKELVSRHEQAAVFHSVEWLTVLNETYRYRPIVFTTCPPGGELLNGIVFCDVRSWITGKRLVSLPFSDHCQPLFDNPAELSEAIESIVLQAGSQKWKYIEVRPVAAIPGLDGSHFGEANRYSLQTIDLTRNSEDIFRSFHESCVRRKIRRAEREQLDYEAGRSEQLLAQFRHLLLLTRIRHKAPPQPLLWFQMLLKHMGDNLTIRVISHEGRPIAALLTLQHNRRVFYKYGCSDADFHKLGAMPLLFWRTIQESKSAGAIELDLGRSDPEAAGLVAFKTHLGAREQPLQYFRSPAPQTTSDDSVRLRRLLLRETISHLPKPVFSGIGSLFYKHLG